MSLEIEINEGLAHGLIDADSEEFKRVEEETLRKGRTLKFDDEQYPKAIEITKRCIHKELGGNRLKISKIGYRILQERGVKFNYV